MERIQSAIQKAREARQDSNEGGSKQKTPSAVVGPGQKRVAQAPIALSEDRLWLDLPDLKLNTKRLNRARVFAEQTSDAAAPFDVLRTRMMHQMNTNNWRRVAVTSPGSGCGKTTLCMNLAFSFARQRDIRTMVIDLDMRRPSVEKILELNDRHQFSDALERQSAAEGHMVCHEGKLVFATNSKPVQNPAELLQDKGAAHVVDQLEERYKPDVMLFDMPPMLACDDTYAFLDQIDCVILVAAAEDSTADELEKCKRDIDARCNLMGVVLNKCRYLDKSDSYSY